MSIITVTIKYDDGQKAPSFSPGIECLGGTVSAVAFYDALEKLEDVEYELAEAMERAES